MAAILASNSCCRHFFESSEDFGFSRSISNLNNFTKPEGPMSELSTAKRFPKFVAEVRQVDSDKYGSNGRPTKMVSTKDLIRSNSNGNGHVKPSAVNGSKVVVNGANLVKKESTSALVKTRNRKAPPQKPKARRRSLSRRS
uniref:Uncharacterized protein n=1 Tax=Ananas comosus var. bracteatus TaxID=296719 RepID=A0A6V7Q8U5_ANACO|nr:unnamed protein product [Ananas comosus var. bracteatus]